MRSIGGGVGAGHTMPGGNTTEVSEVGVGAGASVTTGGPEVPVVLPPHAISARPKAAQKKAVIDSCDAPEIETLKQISSEA
jgi:hypothetical protein